MSFLVVINGSVAEKINSIVNKKICFTVVLNGSDKIINE